MRGVLLIGIDWRRTSIRCIPFVPHAKFGAYFEWTCKSCGNQANAPFMVQAVQRCLLTDTGLSVEMPDTDKLKITFRAHT